MMKKTYRPKNGHVVIRVGRSGGKQFQHSKETKLGMLRRIYDYPPPTRSTTKKPTS